jgi:hypothetical protein
LRMDIICSNVSCFTPNNRLNASSLASFCFFPRSRLYSIISEVLEQVYYLLCILRNITFQRFLLILICTFRHVRRIIPVKMYFLSA